MSNTLHSKACLAHALICAIENFRDNPDNSDFDFRINVQGTILITEADTYLDRDMVGNDSICKCGN